MSVMANFDFEPSEYLVKGSEKDFSWFAFLCFLYCLDRIVDEVGVHVGGWVISTPL